MPFKSSSEIFSHYLGRIRKKMRIDSLPKSGWVEVKRMGFHWRLDMDTDIGRAIAVQGIIEPQTTRLVKDLVRPGMQVLDVGANIGYFTLIMAQAAGLSGRVWAFEPTKKYREQLMWHVENNNLKDIVTLIPYGLSDKTMTTEISIGNSSATLHWTAESVPLRQEIIQLHPLDEVAAELGIHQIDFVKLDIDGHEPRFIRGASNSLKRFQPPIVLEFSQLNLHFAGSDVSLQARLLQELGYAICDERTRKPYVSDTQFLIDCGNFRYSGNALAISETVDRKSNT